MFERLAAPKEAGAFVRLSTGFGGGKTHTLMAFWHLANNVADASLGTELVPAVSRPKKVTVAAIDAGEAGVPDFSLHGKTIIQSLWGELFYQLGGKDGWTKLGKADHPEASPREKLIETVMPSGPVLIQGPDEQILQRPQGQVSVMNFLKAKGLVYEPGDALDTGRFLKDVLPGTTPIPGDPAVYTAKAIHERFLSAPKLRLVPDPGVVRQTLVKAIAAGKLVVKTADGRAYDAAGCVEGPENARRRSPASLTSPPLDEATLVTTRDSAAAAAWLSVDARGGDKTKPPKSEPVPKPGQAQVTATTWEKVAEYAKERPLLELKLTASSPSAAATLAGLAQPLGADALTLTVSAGGPLKDGGMMSFSATEVKPNHPLKPLEVAQKVFGTLAEGATYEAQLALTFGTAGRTGLDGQFEELRENAPDAVTPSALFGKVDRGPQ